MVDRGDIEWLQDTPKKPEMPTINLEELFSKQEQQEVSDHLNDIFSTQNSVQQEVREASTAVISRTEYLTQFLTTIEEQLSHIQEISAYLMEMGFYQATQQIHEGFRASTIAFQAFAHTSAHDAVIEQKAIWKQTDEAFQELCSCTDVEHIASTIEQSLQEIQTLTTSIQKEWESISFAGAPAQLLERAEQLQERYQICHNESSALQEAWNARLISKQRHRHVEELFKKNTPTTKELVTIQQRERAYREQYLIECSLEKELESKLQHIELSYDALYFQVIAAAAARSINGDEYEGTEKLPKGKERTKFLQEKKQKQKEQETFYEELYTYYTNIVTQYKTVDTALQDVELFLSEKVSRLLSKVSALHIPNTVVDETYAKLKIYRKDIEQILTGEIKQIEDTLNNPAVQRILARRSIAPKVLPTLAEEGRALRVQTEEAYLKKAREQLLAQDPSLLHQPPTKETPQAPAARKHTGSLAYTLPVRPLTFGERLKNTFTAPKRTRRPASPLKRTDKERERDRFDQREQERASTVLYYFDAAASLGIQGMTNLGLRPKQIVAWERLQLTHHITKERYEKNLQILRTDLEHMREYVRKLQENSIAYQELHQNWVQVEHVLQRLATTSDEDMVHMLPYAQEALQHLFQTIAHKETTYQRNPNYSPLPERIRPKTAEVISSPQKIEIALKEGITLPPAVLYLLHCVQDVTFKDIPLSETEYTLFQENIPVKILHRTNERGLLAETFLVYNTDQLSNTHEQTKLHGVETLRYRTLDNYTVVSLGASFIDQSRAHQKEILEHFCQPVPAHLEKKVAGDQRSQEVLKNIFSFSLARAKRK